MVALASGRLNFGSADAAAVLESALRRWVCSFAESGARLTVDGAAKACFEALIAADLAHSIPGHGVVVVVAGYDEGQDVAQVYEFTAPDTTGGPGLSPGFLQDRFLALPIYNDTSDLVRAEFGLLTTDQYCERLDHFADDPMADFRGQLSLAGEPLSVVARSVTDVLPTFLATDPDRLDMEGIGGEWLVCRVWPNVDVEDETYAWGPMRPGTSDTST
ncbi:hypothetical protein ASC58_13645 [Phycicoccus sp. Root101]|nr:hypothetical protein ASC58_13645 [Phycicoccus sp. Root101]